MIGADESIKDEQDAHLYIRIPFSPEAGSEGGLEIDSCFYFLCTAMHALAYGG